MTKEEAVNHIRYGIIEENYHLPKELGIEACEMAIKALEQDPCVDCISRDEAIRVAEQGQIQGYEWQFKKLCNLPSVTPQPKTGRWIFTKTILDKYGCTAECPSCHKKWKTYDEIRWEKENKFCPNCGAKIKMQEVEENDD